MKLLQALALTALVACSAETETTDAPRSKATGEMLFESQNCQTCHGPRGVGLPGMGPKLQGVAELWTVETMSEYLADPEAYAQKDPRLAHDSKYRMKMPKSGLRPDARQRLAEYVLGL